MCPTDTTSVCNRNKFFRSLKTGIGPNFSALKDHYRQVYWIGSSTKEAKDSRHSWMEKKAWNMPSDVWLGVVSNLESLHWVRTDTKSKLVSS